MIDYGLASGYLKYNQDFIEVHLVQGIVGISYAA